MKFEDLKPGIMLEGILDKPVTLELCAPQGDRIKLIYVRDDGDMGYALLSHTELNDIHLHHTPHGTPWRAKAAVEMLRHKYAQGGKISHGEMDPLPHQIQSIFHITNQYGDVRFMLADEPGAGKTAVASSIILEMQLQGRAHNVLIVVPANLKYQWREELKRFVGLKGYVVESGSVHKSNPWPLDDHNILITSIDYAKREENREALKHTQFDLVVVDEAHHMNSSGKNVSVRYRLGEILSKVSTHLLFLTATPHRGKPENFRLLLKLLDDIQFDGDLTPEEVSARKTPFFMRHLKHEMTDMEGRQIFTKRHIHSLAYEMSPPEKDMYKMVSNYVRTQHRRLVSQGERLAPFVLLLIQKRMASSTHALQKTLENRRGRLQYHLESGKSDEDRPEWDDDAWEGDYDEDDPEYERRAEILSGITASRTPEELREEIAELDDLIGAADEAATTKPDRKLEKVYELIDGLEDKLLIFSEYTDTIDYLQDNLQENLGETICRIDGNMKQEERDKAVQNFRDKHRIMVASDAAREGMNMQFCNVMVNYDLPWSPIVLEQRMGRLHRYGQKKDVFIHNMVAVGTIEGNVLERLREKIEEIQTQYDTVDIIGTILSEVNMNDIMVEAIGERTLTNVDVHMLDARKQVELTASMLENTPVSLEGARRTQKEVEEKHVDGEYLVRMLCTVFEGLGGRFSPNNTRLKIPDELRSKSVFPNKEIRSEGPLINTLTRGTKYYKHIESWITQNCMSDLRGGSVFGGKNTGYIVFHTTELKNPVGKTVEVLVHAHHIDGGNTIQAIHPDVLYDLEEVGGDPGSKPDTDRITGIASDEAQERADSLNARSEESWDKLVKIRNSANNLDKWEEEKGNFEFGAPERKEIEEKIRQFKISQRNMRERAKTDHLYAEGPRMIGWVKVVRNKETQDTEIRGMNRSMEMERKDGFIPYDVSNKHDGRGYDILSKHPDGRERHIEVKARCSFTGVEFTRNEENARLNDPNCILHSHVIDGDECHTRIIEDPSKLKTKREIVFTVPISELNRFGEVYEYSDE
ncbi:MAG: DEAD/DEAH box helicase [Cenarchaeum sp. SB0677_bin_16]|nr:DEAD/DEAH box helicase [Cenarchaeum sp. SB0677_bin_16]